MKLETADSINSIREHYKWLKPNDDGLQYLDTLVLENTISDWNFFRKGPKLLLTCIREHYKWLKHGFFLQQNLEIHLY